MIKRFFSNWPSGLGYSWGSADLQESEIEYLGTHGWEMGISLDPGLDSAPGYKLPNGDNDVGLWDISDISNVHIDPDKVAAIMGFIYPLLEKYDVPLYIDLEVLLSAYPYATVMIIEDANVDQNTVIVSDNTKLKDYVTGCATITDRVLYELNIIESLDPDGHTVTMEYPLANTYHPPELWNTACIAAAVCPLSPQAEAYDTITHESITHPLSVYDEYYGDALTVMESPDYSPLFKGYHWEAGYDSGVEWIKARTTGKTLTQWIYHGAYYPISPPQTLPDRQIGNPPTHWATHDLAWRIAQVDEIIYEVESVPDVAYAVDMGTYVKAHDKQFGVLTMMKDPSPPNHDIWWAQTTWWGDEFLHATPCLPLADQQKRAAIWLNYIQSKVGAFDIIEAFGEFIPNTGIYSTFCEFMDGLQLGRTLDDVSLTGYYQATS